LESEYEVFEKDYAFGWADLNIVRHAELINKLDSMMLTHLDVLNDVENIRIAKNYILKNDDGETEVFHESLPAIIDDWEDMIPQFIDLPGW
jgi:adenylosuccinate synthase